MEKKATLRKIFECADKFKENLANRNILFLCMNAAGKVTTLEVGFIAANFRHMTGVKFITVPEIEPNAFYQMCVDRRLTINDFDLAKDGSTEQKLNVLPYLLTPNLHANMVGDYQGVRPLLYTEKLAGNVRGCIGFIQTGKRFYSPNTVLEQDIRNLIKNPLRVVAIYRKYKKEERYSELVYKAKKVDWKQIRYPEEFAYLMELV